MIARRAIAAGVSLLLVSQLTLISVFAESSTSSSSATTPKTTNTKLRQSLQQEKQMSQAKEASMRAQMRENTKEKVASRQAERQTDKVARVKDQILAIKTHAACAVQHLFLVTDQALARESGRGKILARFVKVDPAQHNDEL